MERKSMLIYFDYEEIFDEFSDVELGELFRAVFSFCINGEMKNKTDFSDRAVFQIYKKMVNDQVRNMEKYKEACERQRRRAWFGRHPDATEEDYQKYLLSIQPRQATAADNDNVNDNENNNDNENDNVNEKVKEKDARENHQGKLNYGKDIIEYCKIKHFDFRDLSAAELSRLTTNPNWKLELDSIIALERIAI